MQRLVETRPAEPVGGQDRISIRAPELGALSVPSAASLGHTVASGELSSDRFPASAAHFAEVIPKLVAREDVRATVGRQHLAEIGIPLRIDFSTDLQVHCGHERACVRLDYLLQGEHGQASGSLALKMFHPRWQSSHIEELLRAEQRMQDLHGDHPTFRRHFAALKLCVDIPVETAANTANGAARLGTEYRQSGLLQVCEWIGGTRLDKAVDEGQVTIEQIWIPLVKAIISAWRDLKQDGSGLIWDTDIDDIILTDSARGGHTAPCPVFYDPNGGEELGDLEQMVGAIGRLGAKLTYAGCAEGDDRASFVFGLRDSSLDLIRAGLDGEDLEPAEAAWTGLLRRHGYLE